MLVWLILIIIFIVLFSAFFSLVETSIFSVKDTDVDMMVEKDLYGAKCLKKIKQNLGSTISAIVILNNTSNIVGSILVGYISAKSFDGVVVIFLSVSLTILIIIFGEILPKQIGALYARQISRYTSRAIFIATNLLSPLIYPLKWFMQSIEKKRLESGVSEEEIKLLGAMGAEQGSIEKNENFIIQNAFKLNDLTAEDVMTPRNVLNTLLENMEVKNVVKTLEKIPHSRLPVFDKNNENIVGVCMQRQIFVSHYKSKEENTMISDIMKEVILVEEEEFLSDILKKFLQTKQHLAVVKDSFGTILGVITLEDILEVLVGSIMDETDVDFDLRKKAEREVNK